MLRRLTPRLSLALVLGLCAPFALSVGGCRKGDLVETEVPAAGVELRYDLAPGATYEGSVDHRESTTVRGNTFNQTTSFTVQLVVQGLDEDGNALVAATISNIKVNLNMVDAPPALSAEVGERTKARLEGATIRFFVKPNGEVFEVPSPPPELPDADARVLQMILDGLVSAFYEVPPEPVTAAEGWTAEDTRGREGKLGKYVKETTNGQLTGMYKHQETGQTLAQLEVERDRIETNTTKDDSKEIRVRETTKLLFDVEDNYLSSIESKRVRTDGPNVVNIRLNADWTRSIAGQAGAAATVEPEPEPERKTQAIADPCSDDYVGPDSCADPCSVNYIGEETCAESGEDEGEDAEDEDGEGEDAAAEGEDAEDEDAEDEDAEG